MAILCVALVCGWLALLCAIACVGRLCQSREPFRKVLWGVGAIFLAAILYYPAAFAARVVAPRSIAVLLDPTYSMVDPAAGMPPQAIEDAKAIVEGKILLRTLAWGDREWVYAVAPDFARAYHTVPVVRSSDSLRVRVGTSPSKHDRFSDYLGPITNLGRILQPLRGTKLLFVVGDLLHQVPGGPNPAAEPPPPPTRDELGLFRGVTVVMIYPETRARPYEGHIIPFWRTYFAARGVVDWANQPDMQAQTFAQTLGSDALLPGRPLCAAILTTAVLLALTVWLMLACLRHPSKRGSDLTSLQPPDTGD